MANAAHLGILKRGVKAWNQWRNKNYTIRPDLRGAIFRGINLSGANFIGTDLHRAQFSEVNLSLANLRSAVLHRAVLRRVVLNGTILRRTDLSQTILSEVILSKAELVEADLSEAELTRVDLQGANLGRSKIGATIFAKSDLSAVMALDTVKHTSPSTVGVDTLYRSKGKIPDVFLRGCGLSDWQIEAVKLHQRDLTNEEIGDIIYRIHELRAAQPIQINPLFISYTHTDVTFVDKIERYLVKDGIRFWRDVHHATAGRLERQVDRAMRLNPTVLLILSENSVRSDWVEHEARLAHKLEKELGRDVLCPVALDLSWKQCRWPERLREQIEEYNILDFSNWGDKASFERMYRRLVDGLDLFYQKKETQ
jgi:hypothetical protein